MGSLVEDVREFFSRIGYTDGVLIKSLASDSRQQNVVVESGGIKWWIRQEGEEQDLEFGTYNENGPKTSVQDIDFVFRPPSNEEIANSPQSNVSLIKFKNLREMAPYVAKNLQNIVGLVSSEDFLRAVDQVEYTRRRLFEARRNRRS